MKISIILPVYNEEKTIVEILDRLNNVVLPNGFSREIIIINDGSTDKTGKILEGMSTDNNFIFSYDKNFGKGHGVIKGLKEATGDIVVIQDADLEYDPVDFNKLLIPIINGQADVVFGSRFLGGRVRLVTPFWHKIFNNALTLISNLLTNLTLSDMETCYKMFSRVVVDDIKDKLSSPRFGIEPELTALVKNYRIYEVPISYFGRSRDAGKKITWIDGVAAIWHIMRFNLWR